MMALKLGAPEDYMQLLQEHADAVNLPRIGVDENVALSSHPSQYCTSCVFAGCFRYLTLYVLSFIYVSLYNITSREGAGGIYGLLWPDGWSYG